MAIERKYFKRNNQMFDFLDNNDLIVYDFGVSKEKNAPGKYYADFRFRHVSKEERKVG